MGNKRKSYYNNQSSNKAKKSMLMFGDTIKLGPNMKGFLISYNCKFTFLVNEAKKILQQFSTPNETKSQSSNSNDLEKLLQQELDTLNSRDKELCVLETGAKYTIFVNLNSVDPNQVVESIFEHIETTKKPLGRYVQRLLPILNTCKSYLEDIEKCLSASLDDLDAIKQSEEANQEPKPFKYCCVFKSSNNGNVKRDDVFRSVGNYLQSKNKQNKVDFDEPDYVVLIHVICNICYLSFVKKFFQYRKYNLIEMGTKFNPQPIKKSVTTANKEEPEDAIQEEEGSCKSDKSDCEDTIEKEADIEKPLDS